MRITILCGVSLSIRESFRRFFSLRITSRWTPASLTRPAIAPAPQCSTAPVPSRQRFRARIRRIWALNFFYRPVAKTSASYVHSYLSESL